MKAIITFICFQIWYTHPVHEGPEYKVYLLEIFQTDAYSLSMYNGYMLREYASVWNISSR